MLGKWVSQYGYSQALVLDSNRSIDDICTAQAGDGVSHCTNHREMGSGTRVRGPDPGSGSGALARGLIMNPRYDT